MERKKKTLTRKIDFYTCESFKESRCQLISEKLCTVLNGQTNHFQFSVHRVMNHAPCLSINKIIFHGNVVAVCHET